MEFTIKQARTHAGMTQADMAKELGISRGTYMEIEKDVSRATVGQINMISKATNIPVANLILA